MSYTKKNKSVLISVLAIISGLMIGLGSVANAADAKKGEKPAPPPLPPFIKAPVVDTQYTKDCKPLGLTKAPKDAKRRTFALNPSNFKRMEKAANAMGEELYDEALVILKELEERAASRPYDLAKAHEYLGYVYLSKGKYETAISYFRKVIDQKILPVRNEQSLIRNVAGLYLSTEPPQPEKAMGIIKAWFKTAVKPKSNDYVLLAQASVLGKAYGDAICPMRMAINLSDRPKNSWFDILVAAHFEAKDYKGAAVIAKERLLSFPETAKYWRQLSGLYNKLERPMDALVIMELAYKQNMLAKGSEYKNLSSMYAFNELPYKSAAVMEDGLKKGLVKAEEKTWRQAAGGWQLSRESKKAIAAYAKAGDFSEHGKNEMRIGTLYSDREEWKNAIKYFRKSLKKGGLKKDQGRVHMNLGIALFNDGKPKDAIKSLQKAQTFKGTKRNASQWINYVRDAAKLASN
ncbi:MAG: tetratricopeptide repeat protein [Gammaproteobacteria bacterium]|nr:tetratricopeptide repeat protein [Gammaproteobacteria bacterium]